MNTKNSNMKTSMASLFGLTHREMAMALGIPYSQWSMYECGKRSLPMRAQLLLNEMLAHVQSLEARRQKDTPVDPRHTKHLESLLKDNVLQQLRLARRIEPLDRKHAAASG